jgi:hypothetical protein
MAGATRLVTAFCCGFLLVEPVAWADPASDAAGLKQFEDGRAAFEKGRYAEALTSFEASLQALPSPRWQRAT